MSAGIISIAVNFPNRWMPNDFWRENYPDMVLNAEKAIHNQVWRPDVNEKSVFNDEMMPYCNDPFRGAVGRRWLEEGQQVLSIEVEAALSALSVLKLTASDIDLCIVGSYFPDYLATGNAPLIAKALDLPAAAWNLESACSSSLLGFKTAAGLVDAGQHERVLVVNSCSYSRYSPETESISWANGDGASAFIVGRDEDGYGYLGGYSRHTGQNWDALSLKLEKENDKQNILMKASKDAGTVIRQISEKMLPLCVGKALDKANVRLEDIDFFVFNSPTAWYTNFCAKLLGIDERKTINTHPLYANTGPVLMPTNLFHAAHEGLVKEGDLVLLYSIGSGSSAAAVVMRWRTAQLGPLPPMVNSGIKPGGIIE